MVNLSLNTRNEPMESGLDWCTPTSQPILAAGGGGGRRTFGAFVWMIGADWAICEPS